VIALAGYDIFCIHYPISPDSLIWDVSCVSDVTKLTAYHHGEASLHGTIIGMAQNFVGSNNLPLLMPNGQFGTRDTGGKDHASARYIHTQLDPVTRLLFKEHDDPILSYIDEEGQRIEPEWYA
jgi:DNA topoisomerase-2